MQQSLQSMQEQMKTSLSTGTAGNGLVTVTLNGKFEMTDIKIKPECVDPEDVEGLVDLIRAAHNDAVKKSKANQPSIPGMPEGFPSLDSFDM